MDGRGNSGRAPGELRGVEVFKGGSKCPEARSDSANVPLLFCLLSNGMNFLNRRRCLCLCLPRLPSCLIFVYMPNNKLNVLIVL